MALMWINTYGANTMFSVLGLMCNYYNALKTKVQVKKDFCLILITHYAASFLSATKTLNNV